MYKFLAQIPDPGSGTAPPGSERFLLVLEWGAWIVTGLLFVGLLIQVVQLAIARNQGQSVQLSGLGWWATGCIIMGTGAGLITALTGN